MKKPKPNFPPKLVKPKGVRTIIREVGSIPPTDDAGGKRPETDYVRPYHAEERK